MDTSYSEQLSNGLIVTIIGVSMVFVFLILLIFAIQLMSKFVQKYQPPIEDENDSQMQRTSHTKEKEALAILVAHQHRK